MADGLNLSDACPITPYSFGSVTPVSAKLA